MHCFRCCCIFNLNSHHQQASNGWIHRLDQLSPESDEQNIYLEQIYWFKTRFLYQTSTNAGNESLASSTVWWPNKNSCNPEVTQSSDSNIHCWFKLVIADFFIYFFYKSSFHWWRARYQMLFSHRKHCACFKGKIYGRPFPRLPRMLSFLPFVTPPWGKCTKSGRSTAFEIFPLPAVPPVIGWLDWARR